ncbi:MAG: VWA domain-containing protein [Oscillospiraceae bacterium]|jgi:Mg-chelatase subunit ChlD|nr:VWA domain-containing protein [Oscillospiraceae bacterium]
MTLSKLFQKKGRFSKALAVVLALALASGAGVLSVSADTSSGKDSGTSASSQQSSTSSGTEEPSTTVQEANSADSSSSTASSQTEKAAASSSQSSSSSQVVKKKIMSVPTVAAPSNNGLTNSNGEAELGVPAHQKYIKKNSDGTYTLSLNVTGDSQSSESQTAGEADVVLVIDTSGSMNEGGGNGSTRLSTAQAAAKSLATKLLDSKTNSNGNIQVAVVDFATRAATPQALTTNYSAVAATINALHAGGGTNWEAGLKAANNIQARRGAEKYIIFLSDGDPTYRNTSVVTSTETDFLGNTYNKKDGDDEDFMFQTWGVHGSGNDDPYSANYKCAVDEANKRGEGVALFSVSAAAGVTRMTDFATATKGAYYDGTDAKKLNAAFNNIYKTITKTATYKGVSITDTLSQYAQFASNNFTYTTTDATGTATTWSTAPQASVSGNTLTWDLGENMVLEKGTTYTVSFNIKPTDAASDYLTNNNGVYPNKGDTGTDAPGNNTSSGKDGFFSNATAKVAFTVVRTEGNTTSSTNGTANYAKPVLQVTDGAIRICKTFTGSTLSADQQKGVTFTVKNSSGATVKTVTYDSFTNGSYLVRNLKEGSYTVTESNNQIDGYKLTASSTSVAVKVTAGQTYFARFTNQYSQPTLTVKKVISGKMSETNKEFTFTLTLSKDGKAYTDALKGGNTMLAANSNGTYTFKLKGGNSISLVLPYNYSYTVTEDKNDNKDYTTTIVASDSNHVDIEVPSVNGQIASDQTLTYTNEKEAVVPTGVSSNTAPYAVICGIALAAGAAYVVSRKKRV